MSRIEEIRERSEDLTRYSPPITDPAWKELLQMHQDILYLLSEYDRQGAEVERIAGIRHRYAQSARLITLYLKDLCNMSLPYDEKIADAAYKAAAEIDRLIAKIEQLEAKLAQKTRELERYRPKRWTEAAEEMCDDIGSMYWICLDISRRTVLAEYVGEGWFQADCCQFHCTDITHWMPANVPGPPKEETNG